MRWLKHAFAVDPPGPAEPTPEQEAAVDAVCRQIVKRHLTTPSLLFLEMSRPLNYVGAQLLHFFGPFLSVLTHRKGHRDFAAFLEHRGAIDYLCRRIEELEAQATRQDAEPSQDIIDETRTDLPDESA
jgi:hypothetical protein